MSADILVGNSHGLFVFTPLTSDGREWLEEHVEDHLLDQYSESIYCDDRRMAMDIAQGALNDGLLVE